MTSIPDIAAAVIQEYDADVSSGLMPEGLVDFNDLQNHCDANMYAEQQWLDYEAETGREMADYVPEYQEMVENTLGDRRADQGRQHAAHVAARRYVAAADAPSAAERDRENARGDRYAELAQAGDLSVIHRHVLELFGTKSIVFRPGSGDRLMVIPDAFADALEQTLGYRLDYPLARLSQHS